MLNISKEQILSIRASELRSVLANTLHNRSLADTAPTSLTENDWMDLHDACQEALLNESPIVRAIDAEQSKGIYTIFIRGVPGAFFVWAPEFDDAGVFSRLSEALEYVDFEHGEFLLNPEDLKRD